MTISPPHPDDDSQDSRPPAGHEAHAFDDPQRCAELIARLK